MNNINNSPVKNTEINIFNEFIFPIIFYISFVVLLIKNNIKYFVLSLLSLTILLWLKIIITIYDNYSHPDFILKELIFPISQIVYFVNSLLLLSTIFKELNFGFKSNGSSVSFSEYPKIILSLSFFSVLT